MSDVASHLLGKQNPFFEERIAEGSPAESAGKERRNKRHYLEQQLGRKATENEMFHAGFQAKMIKGVSEGDEQE